MKLVIGVDTNSFYLAAAVLPELAPDAAPEFVAIGRVIEKGKIKKYALGRLAGERIPKLCLAFYYWLREQERLADFIEVWCEDYAYVGGSRSTAEVAQCVGAVKDACIMAGVPCYTINNSTWKLEVVGKGNASKDETKAFLISHFGWVPPDLNPPDLYDAIGVALAGARRGQVTGVLARNPSMV